jgi:hypothetical protein
VKEWIFRVVSGTFCRLRRIRIQNSEQNEIRIRIQLIFFGSTTMQYNTDRN